MFSFDNITIKLTIRGKKSLKMGVWRITTGSKIKNQIGSLMCSEKYKIRLPALGVGGGW